MSSSSSSNTQKGVHIPEDIILQLLNELPAKSLLRFRCVSKLWCSIIDDPLFVDSHRTRSHTRPGAITILVQTQRTPTEDACHFFSLDPEGGGGGGGSPPAFIQTVPSEIRYLVSPLASHSVNGLVCFGNYVWNPTTRESIRLPPFIAPGDLDDFPTSVTLTFYSDCALGFDRSTMEYKVLDICEIRTSRRGESPPRALCKILTIGTNLWRTIDSPPRGFWEFRIKKLFCINGTIYWWSFHSDELLAFDVGRENFRLISLPIPDREDKLSHYVQVEERVGVIDNKFKKIWILDDNGGWNMETLVMPDWVRESSRTSEARLTPVGTIHTSEILLHWRSYDNLKLFYLDPFNKTFRWIHFQLPETYTAFQTFFTKQVECLFRLKGRA